MISVKERHSKVTANRKHAPKGRSMWLTFPRNTSIVMCALPTPAALHFGQCTDIVIPTSDIRIGHAVAHPYGCNSRIAASTSAISRGARLIHSSPCSVIR